MDTATGYIVPPDSTLRHRNSPRQGGSLPRRLCGTVVQHGRTARLHRAGHRFKSGRFHRAPRASLQGGYLPAGRTLKGGTPFMCRWSPASASAGFIGPTGAFEVGAVGTRPLTLLQAGSDVHGHPIRGGGEPP